MPIDANENINKPTQKGLIVSYFGNSVAVEAANGQVFQCYLRRNQDLPVVGDVVEWSQTDENSGSITAIIPRKTVLTRGDQHGKSKPIAANVDVLAVVMAPPPVLSEQLIDRYLIAAELLGITPIIVVNKADLLSETQKANLINQLSSFSAIPCQVILTSALTEEGLDKLAASFNGKAAVLVGPSGVGKSSIITKFVQQDIRVGDVSDKGVGKHTTTATRYYHLPQGGGLIDSPGLRDFTLWPVTHEELLRGFKEFQPYLSGCKFRDCRHVVEPGCVLLAAVEQGKVNQRRFDSYLTFVKDQQQKK